MNNVTYRDMKLYAITDSRWLDGISLEEKVEQALAAGATFLQLRDKEAGHDELVAMAVKLKSIAAKYNVPFVINDDVWAAKEADVDGVHIGQSDISYSEARKILGPNKIIGMTTKTVEQAKHAQELGADYIGTGAVFGTNTKSDTIHMTKETLLAIADSVDIPIVAIGGIKFDNMDYLKDTGVSGVAVVSAIFAAEDVTQATTDLRKKADKLFDYSRKNIIFDMDGTLLDSMPYWRHLAREYSISKGAVLPENFDEITYSMDIDECGVYMRDTLGINETPENMRKAVLDIINEHYRTDIPMKQGMKRLLLREKSVGSRMCIFTSSDKECASLAMERLGVFDCFEKIMTSYEIEISKKDPASYQKVCEIMGFDADNTYVYEDVYHGVKSAKAAGFKVVAVYDEDSKQHWDEICTIADDYIE